MKRPLCVMSLIMAAIVFIYLELFSSKLTAYEPEKPDGTLTTVMGVVAEKQKKLGFLGEELTVIHLIPGSSLKGNFKYIECYLSEGSYEPSIGETILISGKVSCFAGPRNPGEFDSRLYYSTLKIAYRLKNSSVQKSDGKTDHFKEGLYKVRCILEQALDKALNAEDSAIMKAMLLGDKAFMDEEIKELYKNSGIMHILAVSGLHISIIGMGLYKLLRKMKVQKHLTVFLPIAFMFCYGAMCGMNTSAFRAILMFALHLIAPLLGRTYDILTSLSLAAMLLLIDQPLYLYNSGFLFSFGAIIGIVVIKPALEAYGGKDISFSMKFADDKKEGVPVRVVQMARDGLLTCISVMIVTLPVYTSFYYTVPLSSLVLNLVVLPLMGLLMTLGISTMLLGMLSGFIGSVIGLSVHLILLFYKTACSLSNKNGGFTWYVGHSEKIQVVIYVALIVLFIFADHYWDSRKFLKKKSKKDAIHAYLFKVIFLLFSVVILTLKTHPDLEINMLDVGQGDGIVISCEGRNILIDGGSTSKKKVGKYSIIPFLKYKGIGKLDAVVITHEDQDHISGVLEIMDDMEKGGIVIKSLFLPDVSQSSREDNYRKLETRAKELGIPINYISCGESFSVHEAEFTCLNPTKDMVTEGANAYSTVLFMRYGKLTALFTGDVEKEGQEHLLEDLRKFQDKFGNITILKVAHHGSEYTTDRAFLEILKPKIALISCGVDNSYGHPHKELLKRLEDVDSVVYRTDESGAIIVEMKDNKLSIHEYLNDIDKEN